jgi:hypothetical protein
VIDFDDDDDEVEYGFVFFWLVFSDSGKVEVGELKIP